MARSRLLLSCALVALVATAGSACSGGGAGKAQPSHTATPSTSLRNAATVTLTATDLPPSDGWQSRPGPSGISRDRLVLQCAGVSDTGALLADYNSPVFARLMNNKGGSIQATSSTALLRSPQVADSDLAALKSSKAKTCLEQALLRSVRLLFPKRVKHLSVTAKPVATPASLGTAADYTLAVVVKPPSGKTITVASGSTTFMAVGSTVVTLNTVAVGGATFPKTTKTTLLAALRQRALALH